ncbi:hypothetical protein THAOC_15305, partial [Thalassiosira oceanica]
IVDLEARKARLSGGSVSTPRHSGGDHVVAAPIRARYHPQRGQKVPRRGVFCFVWPVGSDREWRAQEKKAPHYPVFMLRFWGLSRLEHLKSGRYSAMDPLVAYALAPTEGSGGSRTRGLACSFVSTRPPARPPGKQNETDESVCDGRESSGPRGHEGDEGEGDRTTGWTRGLTSYNNGRLSAVSSITVHGPRGPRGEAGKKRNVTTYRGSPRQRNERRVRRETPDGNWKWGQSDHGGPKPRRDQRDVLGRPRVDAEAGAGSHRLLGKAVRRYQDVDGA